MFVSSHLLKVRQYTRSPHGLSLSAARVLLLRQAAPAIGKETKWMKMMNKHQKAPGPDAPVQDWDPARGDPGPDVQPQLPGRSWTGLTIQNHCTAQWDHPSIQSSACPWGFPEMERAIFYFEDTRELYQLFFVLSFLQAPSATGEPETQRI